MRIDELIEDQFGLEYMSDEIRVLNRLDGESIVLHRFDTDVDRRLSAWDGHAATYLLTRHLLPIAECAHLTVGLHLLPTHVEQARVAVAQFDPEREQLIDHAHSMRAYLHRELLNADLDGDDIRDDLEIARALFGDEFYETPASQVSPDYVERTMIGTYGGAAADYKDLAFLARSRNERVDWLKRGAEAAPECLYFHWELARLYAEREAFETAAQHFARSLTCYHHTACTVRAEAYYALGRELLERVPAAFSETARRDVMLAEGKARMRWLVSLVEQGDLATSVKLLSDFRYDSGADAHPMLFKFQRAHYEALGWTWASAWCDLCTVDGDGQNRRYWYRGLPLSPGWDQPVRSAMT